MPKRYSLAAAYPSARVLRERDERIEQWHRVAAQDPNVMLLGDPPIERSALAQSTTRREIGSKISLPKPLHQASHSADNRQRELKDLPRERPSDLFARLTTDTEFQKRLYSCFASFRLGTRPEGP